MSVTVLSVLQIILVVVLVILVLLQPPGSSSLSGFSNSQQGMNSIIPVKSSENSLSRITSIVAGLFIINTLLLSGLCSKDVHKKLIEEKIISEKKQEGQSTSVPFENQ
ncbi:preprotein translocase subunit SecG [Wolbachia endosymbiont (group B) of Gerris lacustris]|uniref:preprotein translocase subunit SecG n=1 Tax=Wolbachia endosymbiont (group B) of Gerris lacustris TaxID=3066159 RepID=UPI003340ACDE